MIDCTSTHLVVLLRESSARPTKYVLQVAHDRRLGVSRKQSVLARKLSATLERAEANQAYPRVAAPPAAAGFRRGVDQLLQSSGAEVDLDGLDEAFSPEMIAEARAQMVSASSRMHSVTVVPATGTPVHTTAIFRALLTHKLHCLLHVCRHASALSSAHMQTCFCTYAGTLRSLLDSTNRCQPAQLGHHFVQDCTGRNRLVVQSLTSS